nr:exopolysaccharide biosynthesis protein [Nostoc sp. FACHB-888]
MKKLIRYSNSAAIAAPQNSLSTFKYLCILIFLLAIQLIVGVKTPWLPKRMMNHPMQLTTVQKFLKAGIPWLKRIEAIARPRLSYISTTLAGRVITGIA